MALATRFLPLGLAAGLLAWLGTGCAVYVPATPTTPLVSKGQVEIGVGGHVLPSPLLELNAAYSPTSHLLVSVETGFLGNTGSTTTNNVTTPTPTTTRRAAWGWATTAPPPLPMAGTWRQWAAWADQRHAARLRHLYSISVSVGERVRDPLLALLRAGLRGQVPLPARPDGPVAAQHPGQLPGPHLRRPAAQPPNRAYLEPTAFLRFGKEGFYGQFNFGLSVPLGTGQQTLYSRQLDTPALLLGGSFVVQPGYWGRQDK